MDNRGVPYGMIQPSFYSQSNLAMITPLFGGRKSKTQPQETSPDALIKAFRNGLNDLIHWDRQHHKTPVIRQADTKAMVRQAKRFLVRQRQDVTLSTPFLIGVAGGTASGKTYTKGRMTKLLREEARPLAGWHPQRRGPVVDALELDAYYRDCSKERERLGADRFLAETNLDLPEALTLDQAARDVSRIKRGVAVRAPQMSFVTCKRTEGAALKVPAPFFIVEGLFALWSKPLRKLFDLKIYVDTDRKTIARRWWARAEERGIARNASGRAMFNRGMAMHEIYVAPSKEKANLVLNGSAEKPALEETLKRFARLLARTFYPVRTPARKGDVLAG